MGKERKGKARVKTECKRLRVIKGGSGRAGEDAGSANLEEKGDGGERRKRQVRKWRCLWYGGVQRSGTQLPLVEVWGFPRGMRRKWLFTVKLKSWE